MQIPEIILNKLERGLVLDGKGNWVPITHLKSLEHNVLMHLEAGDVLQEGKWVGLSTLGFTFSEAAGKHRIPHVTTPNSDALVNDVAHITNKKAATWTIVSLNTREKHLESENMVPGLADLGEAGFSASQNMWQKSSNSQFKIIAIVAAAIVLLSLAVFAGIRLIF